eukprot:746115-Hanusia_phi.AAC.9
MNNWCRAFGCQITRQVSPDEVGLVPLAAQSSNHLFNVPILQLTCKRSSYYRASKARSSHQVRMLVRTSKESRSQSSYTAFLQRLCIW